MNKLKNKRTMGNYRVLGLIVLNLFVLIAFMHLYHNLVMVEVDVLTSFPRLRAIIASFLLYLLVSIFHIVVSFVFVPSFLIAVLNKLSLTCTVITTYSSGSTLTLSINLVFILSMELSAFMISMFMIRVLKSFIPPLEMPIENLREFINLSRRGGFIIDNAPIILASHSLSSSIVLMILYYKSRLVFNTYILGINHVLIPLLLLSLLIRSQRELSMSQRDFVTMGIATGTGLIGLVPFIASAILVYESTKYRETKLYFYANGLYLGEAVAALTYGRPYNVFRETPDSRRITIRERRDIWFWQRTSHPIYVKLDELNTPHIIIIGSSGSGKTTLAKYIAAELSKTYGYSLIILDPHGEYGELAKISEFSLIDASSYYLNPLILENTSPRERAMQLSHVISTLFKLGFLQRRMLEEVVMKAYEVRGITQENIETWRREPPTLGDLVDVCKAMSEERPEFQRLLPYLVLLNESMGIGVGLGIEEVLSRNTIIDLSRLSSDFARALFIDTLMYMLLNKMYVMKNTKKIQLIIEEARGIMPRALSRELLSRLFTESRKFGFSIIVISQEINRIPRTLVNNAGLRIFFVLNEPRSIEEASKIIAGSDTRDKVLVISEVLRTLSTHTYIVHATGVNRVYIVRSPIQRPLKE